MNVSETHAAARHRRPFRSSTRLFAVGSRSRARGPESVVQPRSHCTSCGRTLGAAGQSARGLLPPLRGRCRACKAKIPPPRLNDRDRHGAGVCRHRLAPADGWAIPSYCVFVVGLVALSAIDPSTSDSRPGCMYWTIAVATPLLCWARVCFRRWDSLIRPSSEQRPASSCFSGSGSPCPRGMGFGDVRRPGCAGAGSGGSAHPSSGGFPGGLSCSPACRQ